MFVSYCNDPRCKVESPLSNANSFLLGMVFEFPFVLIQFVQLMNDSLRQTTGMVLVCSRCLWFNQFFPPELVQHFLKSSKVFQLERTMLSFPLASDNSSALEYSKKR